MARVLTAKQQKVIELANEGRSPKYIAHRLKITERIAKTYITKLTNLGFIGEEEEPAAEPATQSATEPATQPAIKSAHQNTDVLLKLGATVQFLQLAGGIKQ